MTDDSSKGLQPEFVRRAAFTVIGTKYHGNNVNKEIPEMWDSVFFPRVGEIKGNKSPGIFYGVGCNYDLSTREFDYVAGVEVADGANVPEGMVSWDIPEATYAVFACTLPTLAEAFDRIYHEWFPQSGYKHTGGFEFEYYDEDFVDGQKMYIYVPVAKL